MNNVKHSLTTNQLQLNTTKTKYMIFTPKLTKYKNLSITVKLDDDSEIERVGEYKYLGLVIDDKLTWKSHLKFLKSKLSRSLGILYKLRYLLDKSVLLTILHSLFLSHLQYGILCWARCTASEMKPIQILLNKAIRCINFCHPQDSVHNFLFQDKILTVDDIFKMELAKFMHNYKNGNLPSSFKHYFLKLNSHHNHQTRATKCNYFIPRKNTSKGLKSLSYLGPRLWSEIPDSIRDKRSVQCFGFAYKKFLLLNYNNI